jgi:large subunit ribosomal protein L13e
MVKGNNIIPSVRKMRKHWHRGFIKTFFNQPANKKRRYIRRQDRASKLYPRPVEQLRPVVRCTTQRYNKRQRIGRGFTIDEIKKAGLGVAFARSIGISVDHRRKNKSVEALQINLQRLKAYKEKLVLFPRHGDKARKGLVNDANPDLIKAVSEQNTDRVLLGLPQDSKDIEVVTITKDMKNRQCYRETRQAWVNQYYGGIRDKKKAAEAEKDK